ncbi:hypothetical protein D3C79_1095670 [compost metagenome]
MIPMLRIGFEIAQTSEEKAANSPKVIRPSIRISPPATIRMTLKACAKLSR